jgi:4-phospho-D-threonate 3-dehydrogenase / 4-phospho-D-erythronate 3-dehydrogenase
MPNRNKPLLAVTMGDAAGTGPEIITKALGDPEVVNTCFPLVIGDAAVIERALGYTGASATICAVSEISRATFEPGRINVLDLKNIDLDALHLGKVDPMPGQASYEYIRRGVELALAGEVAAIVTCAINKESLNQAGHHYDGHTGLLAELCGAPDATMMLVVDRLRVSHVSTHVSLRTAIGLVRPNRILRVLELTHDAIRHLGVPAPRLAVAGLNPHAGEHGLFGDDEEKYIIPAILLAKGQGMNVSGPYPGDTIFYRTMQGEFDGAVAMYHDQGHAAVKMLGIWLGVNVTLGLPIVRTSVEHGTNFDLAGTGRSDARSLIEAIKLASGMAKARGVATKRPIQ